MYNDEANFYRNIEGDEVASDTFALEIWDRSIEILRSRDQLLRAGENRESPEEGLATVGGSVVPSPSGVPRIYIYSNPRADNTLLKILPSLAFYIFPRGKERRAREHAPVSPTSCHPPCFRYFTLCYIHIRVAAPLGIPIRKRICARDPSDFADVACEGQRWVSRECRDDVADRCWTEQPLIPALREETNV